MSKKSKSKDFDCVEMKNRIQQDILARYKKRKSEFSSLEAFIKAECDTSTWVKNAIERIRKAHKPTKKSA